METAADIGACVLMAATLWWGGAYAWVIWRDRPAVTKFEDGRVTASRSLVAERRINGRR